MACPSCGAEPLSQKRWLTPSEAAQYLGRPSVNAVRCLMKSGTIPSWTYTHQGGQIRFRREFLDQWMDAEIAQKRSLASRRGLALAK